MNFRDLILRPSTPATKLKIAAILTPVGLLAVVGAFSFVEDFDAAKIIFTAGLCLLIGGLISLSRYVFDKAEGKFREMLLHDKRVHSQKPPDP